MTRTPTIIVTANAIAARAFAWDISTDAQHTGSRSWAPMISPLLP